MQTFNQTPFLRIGTRGSPLALVQARLVRSLLSEAHNIPLSDIEIQTISTSGDQNQADNVSLKSVGGKGLFSKEIESALQEGTIDLAVHSAKDMATALPETLTMPVYLPREAREDAFISQKVAQWEDLPQGAKLGTSSLRRAAQFLQKRPDLQIVEFRGNVDTRLQKLSDGIADATLLACAGLNRLGKQSVITQTLDLTDFPTAPAQGAIGLEIRQNDQKTADLITPLNDPDTHLEVSAERTFLAEIDGSCQTPIGVLSNISDGQFRFSAQLLSPDGNHIFQAEKSGNTKDADQIAQSVAQDLIAQAGPDLMAQIRGK